MRTVEKLAGGRSVRPRRLATTASRVASPPPAFASALPTDWQAEGRAIPEGFYVQVRYPHARRWVTLAASDIRLRAARVAADAYHDRHNGRGETPRQVRIVTAGQLRREGGFDGELRARRRSAGGYSPSFSCTTRATTSRLNPWRSISSRASRTGASSSSFMWATTRSRNSCQSRSRSWLVTIAFARNVAACSARGSILWRCASSTAIS